MKRSRQESPLCTDTTAATAASSAWCGTATRSCGRCGRPTRATPRTRRGAHDRPDGQHRLRLRRRSGLAGRHHPQRHRHHPAPELEGAHTFATATGDPPSAGVATGVSFPGRSWAASLGHPGATDTEDWYGTVPMGFVDRTGLIYRRNRYYDPKAEQFTQPDPIGMAGGLAVYAYVGGDPVNGMDPYGLEQEGCELSGEVTDDRIPGLCVSRNHGAPPEGASGRSDWPASESGTGWRRAWRRTYGRNAAEKQEVGEGERPRTSPGTSVNGISGKWGVCGDHRTSPRLRCERCRDVCRGFHWRGSPASGGRAVGDWRGG